jgi:hypothetical protein
VDFLMNNNAMNQADDAARDIAAGMIKSRSISDFRYVGGLNAVYEIMKLVQIISKYSINNCSL